MSARPVLLDTAHLAQPDIWNSRWAKLTTTDNRLACGHAGLDGKPSTNNPTNEHGNRSSAQPHVTSETMWRDMRLRAECMKTDLRDESDLHNGVTSACKKQGNAHSKTKHPVATPCSCGTALVNMCNFCFTHNGLSRRLLANLRSRKVVWSCTDDAGTPVHPAPISKTCETDTPRRGIDRSNSIARRPEMRTVSCYGATACMMWTTTRERTCFEIHLATNSCRRLE